MKRSFLVIAIALLSASSFAQSIDQLINAEEVGRIVRTLSADDMKGRKTFTPGIDKAAEFIAAEFKKSGLGFFEGLGSYKQSFSMVRLKPVSATGKMFGATVDSKDIAAISTKPLINIDQDSDFTSVFIPPGSNFITEYNRYVGKEKNYIVFLDTSFRKNFSRIGKFKREMIKTPYSTVFVMADKDPTSLYFSFEIKQEITELNLSNVIGVLPGTTKKDEYVVFSGHYDHLGVGKANEVGDSIFNGANDDAAGTSAVILLANYFSKMRNNERTIIFVAFTAEEIGGHGSKYFSKQMDPYQVKAMFNIEMIGTQSKWGNNSAYITGYEKSDMGTILQANLVGSKFHFEADPYPEQKLFYRSDNATLAALGVPAHTISTSKMDSEKFYHTQEDEVETLDMKNMAEIIKAIAISSKTIISGKDTPTRVIKEEPRF